jgi:hypothetical protein
MRFQVPRTGPAQVGERSPSHLDALAYERLHLTLHRPPIRAQAILHERFLEK